MCRSKCTREIFCLLWADFGRGFGDVCEYDGGVAGVDVIVGTRDGFMDFRGECASDEKYESVKSKLSRRELLCEPRVEQWLLLLLLSMIVGVVGVVDVAGVADVADVVEVVNVDVADDVNVDIVNVVNVDIVNVVNVDIVNVVNIVEAEKVQMTTSTATSRDFWEMCAKETAAAQSACTCKNGAFESFG
jgi:hypothetical protein